MTRKSLKLTVVLLAILSLAGCRQDMHDQPKYEPLEASRFFEDGRASRPSIDGTVARGQLREDREFYAGMTAEGELLGSLPIDLSRAALDEGRALFNAFCSPCHDFLGTGNGMVVQRGFKRPTSFHDARLREAPVGYFFDVMTNGFGDMSSYAAQITPDERWAITAYLKVLQLSQSIDLADLPAAEHGRLPAPAEAPVAATSPSTALETPTADPPTSEGGHG